MTITKSGELASFYTVNKAPIKHLRVYFSPKQSGSGDPSPENIRSIEGWNDIDIYKTCKNLLPSGSYTKSNEHCTITYNSNGSVHIVCAGTGTGYLFLSLPSSFERLLPSGTYTLNANFDKYPGNGLVTVYVLFNAQDIQFKTSTTASITKEISSGITKLQVAVRQNYKMDVIIHPQLEIGSVATTFAQPLEYQNIPISWESLGTVYGGYVDLITGEVWKTYDIAYLNDPDLWVINPDMGSSYRYNKRFERKIITNDSYSYTLCTIAKVAFLPGDKYGRWNGWNDKRFLFSGTFTNEYTLEQVKQWASENKITISYLLNTPQLITTLTPTQLQTLLGQNHIWSNADRVEVEYDLVESNDELYRRRNILLQNAPHLKTIQSGNTEDSVIIAHFEAVGEPLTQLTLALPYNSEGYQSATITAAGVNLIGQDMINGLSYGVQFTRYFNSEGLLEYVTAEGTTTSTNTFRNYNYVKNEQRWILGRTATCCYSDAGYFPMVANNDTPLTIEGWVTSRITEDGWRRYNVYDYTSTQSSAWYRFQIISPVKGTEVSTRLYPLVCLAQDMYCDYDPYKGVDYTITLPETFYGGEVDLITGRGISEYAADGTRLSSPNTFSITPQFINTLLGINNIWSNQGLVTVKYWTH